MYDHIGLKVGNLDASVRFYTAALAPLGFVLCSRDEAARDLDPRASRRFGSICTEDLSAPGPTSHSAPPITPRSGNSTPRASRPEAATMAGQARGPITVRPILRRS
jgi:catechol 2,3-dioxygenase-like lactoylglutathione lyase family enzyme